ncbi:hypothetical protein BDQ12DRAFT_728676 [Crucibulum laeve]|uniref:Uncharacterized protein n=1 Tax=Crucibulum laeve TaxID=68775 RepID=A0A5C3LIC3_9AGAR|nr:hypothetical protein BDQ12DRAFT_728676 [Crucibulum laeve]
MPFPSNNISEAKLILHREMVLYQDAKNRRDVPASDVAVDRVVIALLNIGYLQTNPDARETYYRQARAFLDMHNTKRGHEFSATIVENTSRWGCIYTGFIYATQGLITAIIIPVLIGGVIARKLGCEGGFEYVFRKLAIIAISPIWLGLKILEKIGLKCGEGLPEVDLEIGEEYGRLLREVQEDTGSEPTDRGVDHTLIPRDDFNILV